MADQETKRFELTIPLSLYRQLQYLATHSPMGVAPPEVARFMITERVMQILGPRLADTMPAFDRATANADEPR